MRLINVETYDMARWPADLQKYLSASSDAFPRAVRTMAEHLDFTLTFNGGYSECSIAEFWRIADDQPEFFHAETLSSDDGDRMDQTLAKFYGAARILDDNIGDRGGMLAVWKAKPARHGGELTVYYFWY